MSLSRGTQAQALINKSSLVTLEDVSFDIEANVTDLMSIAQGLAGFSHGAKVLNVNFTSFITQSGPEFNIVNSIAENKHEGVELIFGDVTLELTGVFTGGGMSQAVNANAQTTYTFRAPLKLTT